MYVICFDTICTGFTPIKDEFGSPILYDTKEQAQEELDSDPEFYQDDCFVCDYSEIGHKTIYRGSI